MTHIDSPISTQVILRRTFRLLLVACLCFLGTEGQNANETELQIGKCWQYEIDGAGGRVAADRDNIYLVRGGSTVEAVDIETGKRQWSTDVGGAVDSNLVAADGSVLLIRRSVGDTGSVAAILALSGSTGVTRWNYPANGSGRFYLGVADGGVVSVSADGVASLVSVADGSAKWTRKLGDTVNIRTVANNQGQITFADGSRVIIAGIGTDDKEAAAAGEYEVSSIGLSDAFDLYAGDTRGILSYFSRDTLTPKWSFRSGGRISDILVIGDELFAASNDNFVYALERSNGNRIWKRRVAGRISSIRRLDEDNVMVEPLGEGNILLINIKSGKMAGQIVTDAKESIVGTIVPGDGRIAVLTNRSLNLYRIGTCTGKNENGPGK